MNRYVLGKCDQSKDREQQLKSSHETVNEPNATTEKKLTDLNVDCLEQVFLYLSLKDLLNIVHANKQLKPAAELVFARKFVQGRSVTLVEFWCNKR